MRFQPLVHRNFLDGQRIAKRLGSQFKDLPYLEGLGTRTVQDFPSRSSGGGASQDDLREVADVDGLAEKMPSTRQAKRLTTA